MKHSLYQGILLVLIAMILTACGGGGDDICSKSNGFMPGCPVPDFPTTPPPPGFNADVASIALALDGSDDVYAGGFFQIYNNSSVKFIARLNNDGSLDTGFITGRGFDRGVYAVSSANDGSGDVYAAGPFSDYNGMDTNGLARLNSDGSLDAGFVTDTGFDLGPYGFDDPGRFGSDYPLRCAALLTDGSGDIYVGGSFNDFNLSSVEYMVRLTSGGALVR